ncbi:hypothetical protein [Acetivibrio clariflavus]|uniref:Uncharacterized protein n=1 Tax=Acetivibrio clariflavus (strain DSM 19732 / NBRC 101661 / EBR45) TaxID=720554 RepID=G8LTN1_ACECE|nr:hypothetical protein [Acetivibrio clariflavus]AEV70541.1 hypothetical protein Clocl_4107 [Acetivibrio clariflavus DSM 19732]
MGLSLIDSVDFFIISLPEQFLMALFAWVLLGRKEIVRFRNVVFIGVVSALIFYFAKFWPYEPYEDVLVSFLQLVCFGVLIYFGYKLSVLEAALGCLVTLVSFTLAQGIMVVLLRVFMNVTKEEIFSSAPIRAVCFIAEFLIVIMALVFMYKKNINIYYLRNTKLDKSQRSKLGVLALQLAFGLFILILIYMMFIVNNDIFESFEDRALVIAGFVITIIFTLLLIRSVFKIGETIQKEEEVKRQMDGREFVQNIDYLCALIDEKQYGELKRVLQSIKKDIENGIIKSQN